MAKKKLEETELTQRLRMIDRHSCLSLRAQCELLGLHRSRLYYQLVGETPLNLTLMRRLAERWLNFPAEGVLQLQDYLRDIGYLVNVKRIRRLLRKMGLWAVYPKPNLSRLGQAQYIYPYRLKGLLIVAPNQVWMIDITYLPMAKGFLYLVAIIDVFSRFVVGWQLSNSLVAEWVVETLEGAIKQYGKPQIVNSDQGSQFTCQQWVGYLSKEHITISMDGKGRAIDKIYIERFWRTVKYDYVYLWPAEDGWELEQGLSRFFTHYNYHKHHQGVGRQVPAQLYGSSRQPEMEELPFQ